MPLLASAADDNATLMVGFRTIPICGDGAPPLLQSGYASNTIGSYSPTGLTGGEVVSFLYDIKGPCSANGGFIFISGFASNPGKSWLTSVICNGIQNNSALATYSYSNGQAGWGWSQPFGFLNKLGSNVSCTVSHN
jgi:hypothetical protein